MDVGGNATTVAARIHACETAGAGSLDLSELGLTEVPVKVRALTHLTSLALDANALDKLPEWIGELVALEHLSVERNCLTSLPVSIGRLTRLVDLNLDRNLLPALPDSIGDLPRLEQLWLMRNRFTAVPTALRRLTRLTSLRLSDCSLGELPEWIGELVALEQLRVERAELTQIPESIGRLTRLVDLNLDYNRLTSVPACLGDLTRLVSLKLYGNRLTELPDTLRGLTELEFLALGRNRLRSVPEWLGELTELTTVWLSGNRLTALPDCFAALTQLTLLQVGDNLLVELPKSLGALPHISRIGLDNNPLTSPPPEVVAAGTQAVVTFLAEAQNDPVRQWSSKVVVVGEGRVGKTSLLRALRREDHNPNEDSTHGLTVDTLDMRHPSRPPGEDVIMRLSTWDFGGQEIYHATHQFFLTDRSLFLLLWDAQIGWEGSKLHYWLDMIKARAPQAPVVLVATHLGPRPPDLPLDELQETYSGLIVASLNADSASGVGVDEVREVIRQQVARLPLMGVTWPRTWLQAADAVRAAEDKHVTPERLNELLATAGVREPSHQTSLIAALHSLGDLLSYPNDEELCDLVVLRPQWLTTYISRVLDSEEVLEQGGLFQRSLWATLWADVERSMRRYLSRMMENFDLSYQTEDQTASLVVELLPWNPPPYQDEWNSPERLAQHELRLKYRLHTVPPGIPTWFIAREHRFSTSVRWRSGALLKHPDGVHAALVTVDRHAKTAELRVRGSYPHDFFAVLKDGFEQTLQRYPGLDVTRFVPCPHRNQDGSGCRHEFRHEQLRARLDRNPPLRSIECPEHLEDVEVSYLLQGIERPAADRSEQMTREVMEKLDQLEIIGQRRHAEVRGGIEETRAKMLAMVAEQQRGFLEMLRLVQGQQEAICPSVVWVRRVSRREAGHRLRPGDVFQLHLCCEAPGEFHLLEGVEPYEVPANSEFTNVVLPYVHRTLKVLKYVVPVFGAALGTASEDLSKVMKDDLELMKTLLDGLPPELRRQLDDREARSMVVAQDHAEYRQMYALLKHLDPEERWADLNKVTTPEGPTFWLCREHAAFYRQGAHVVGSGSETSRMVALPSQDTGTRALPQET
ncbi:COR domain-containing protein [Streptomyces brasiliscabiei]|uniref:COR domain-containing protein n=1 Tax=Streptomyces brasiliscabiei TaxID=2736302 RepID=UPI001C10F127|nr:COR domain-containing protein [Streptomyces brasiliscabiei]